MSIVTRTDVMHCDVCGYEWLSKKDDTELPTQCPNRECRSRKWNSNKAEATAAPEPQPAHNKEPKAKRKASRPKGRTKVQAISAPATQASQMTTRTQLMPTAHAVNCACYSCHTPDW